jgi:hypothetical protein
MDFHRQLVPPQVDFCKVNVLGKERSGVSLKSPFLREVQTAICPSIAAKAIFYVVHIVLTCGWLHAHNRQVARDTQGNCGPGLLKFCKLCFESVLLCSGLLPSLPGFRKHSCTTNKPTDRRPSGTSEGFDGFISQLLCLSAPWTSLTARACLCSERASADWSDLNP